MRQTLFCLLALIGTAVASHDICVFKDHITRLNNGIRMSVTVNAIGDPGLMDQWGDHGSTARIYSFTNARGRVDVSPYGDWSAAFDGGDWGGFKFQQTVEISNFKYVSWGCYATTNKNYCNVGAAMAMFKRCMEKHKNS